jgi:mannose-6-phosphate isomerase
MQPLVFEPYFRPQIWGDRRLARSLGKQLPEGLFGEAWEISAHPHHVSRVAEGPLRGRTLADLWRESGREILGRDPQGDKFPLLIKFLDCHEQLSVQVHPDDAAAAELLGNELGKTESWLVLDAEPTGRIYAGLAPGVTREALEEHLDRGTVDQCLHSFAPRPGDCVHLPAGTVHAVGGGVLIAEVQQSSDATFRLFDWNRVGPDGQPRPLHRAEALRSIDWSAGPVGPVTPRPLANLPPSVRGESLVDCPYFRMHRYRVEGRWSIPCVGEMSIWIVLDGQVELESYRTFRRGETLLIPATSTATTWRADQPAVLLGVAMAERHRDARIMS